jgi:hypothetical protein
VAGPDVLRDLGDTLLNLLRAGVSAAMVDPARIQVATPDEFESLKDPAQPNITVFFYRIATNPQMRNGPRRILPGGKTSRQALPLEISLLITAWAKETKDELRIVGRILQVLYDRAEVGAAELIGSSWESDDSVQLVLESLPLEDHYRIWDSSDVPYRLSLTYVARVVGISPTEELAEPPVVDARFEISVT